MDSRERQVFPAAGRPCRCTIRFERRGVEQARAQGHAINVVNALIRLQFIEFLAKLGGKQFAKRATEGILTADAGQLFNLTVPTFDAPVQTRGQNADVDGFDDVFAEFLQALVLVRLALQRTVEARIFNGDGDVVRKSNEQIDIVAREEIAFSGAVTPTKATVRPRDLQAT